jgi:hypothetical protein
MMKPYLGGIICTQDSRISYGCRLLVLNLFGADIVGRGETDYGVKRRYRVRRKAESKCKERKQDKKTEMKTRSEKE